MTQDLDALPLPVPTHFRNGVLYAFSADQIRAAHREGYELAKREAQEGREPVARVELMTTGGNVGLATRIVEIYDPLRERLRPGTELYTSPPLLGDEARDAERYRMLRDFDSGKTELAICRWSEHGWVGEWVIEHEPDAAIDAALVAQQKGGA